MTKSLPSSPRPIETQSDFRQLIRHQCYVHREGNVSGSMKGHFDGCFAYIPAKWKKSRTCFALVFQRPPRHIPTLPLDTNIHLLSIHIPEDKDRIRSISDPTATTNLRISKSTFEHLQGLATIPTLRIWLMATDPPRFLAIPSIVFKFTEEEKQKYRDDGFNEDGSDLPTVYGMVRRYSYDGLLAIESKADEVNIMKLFYEYFQGSESVQKGRCGWVWPCMTLDELYNFKRTRSFDK